jgi:2-keto-3-deoxy-L-fuconate dehydrogenase
VAVSAQDPSAQSVLITGGGRGIGRATAEFFQDAGARVGVIDRDVDNVRSGIHAVRADVTDDDEVGAAVAQLAEALGGLDVLVNNVGVSFVGGIEQGTTQDWARLWDVNVVSHVRVTRAALPHLRQSSAPAIVNISSCTATSGLPDRVLYTATKGAVESMTRAMAVDLLAEGIRVNAVNPGTVATEFMEEIIDSADDPAALRAQFDGRQATGRMVAPAEVAAAVAYLASPHARSTVGSVLVVDGGLADLKLPVA